MDILYICKKKKLLKKSISTLLLFLFLGIVISPTAIIVIDSSIDISFFNEFTEESEEKGNKKNSEIESFFFESALKVQTLILIQKKKRAFYVFKKYVKPHLNLVFPPPDYLFF